LRSTLSVLDDQLAEFLTDALIAFDIPQACVVTRSEMGGDPAEPTIITTPHSCEGWVDTYQASERIDDSVLVSDRKVFVVASTLSITPTTSDTVTIGGATFSIISIQRDPAGAAWVLQARV